MEFAIVCTEFIVRPRYYPRMIPTSRIASWLWLAALLIALTFVTWRGHLGYTAGVKLQNITGGAVRQSAPSHESVTGYADGARRLINRSGDATSLQLVEAVQARLAGASFREGSPQSDNAPVERLKRGAFLYREWLVLAARIDHVVTGLPYGICAERVALYAGPVEHLLLVLAGAFLVWLAFGRLPAASAALSLAGGFPLAEAFEAGSPGVSGALVAAWFVSSCLLVRAISVNDKGAGSEGRSWAVSAGGVGALGFDLDATSSVWILVGVVLAGALATLIRRKEANSFALWRAWGWTGGVATVVYYMIGYAEGGWSWNVEANHPVYALLWIGAGELLHGLDAWKSYENASRIHLLATAIGLFLVALPLVWLCRLPDRGAWIGPALPGLWASSGVRFGAFATALPLLTALVSGGLAWRQRSAVGTGWLVAMGPAVLASLLIVASPTWTLLASVLALVPMLVVLARSPRDFASPAGSVVRPPDQVLGWVVCIGVIASSVGGAIASTPRRDATGAVELSTLDAGWLQARDIGHWLRRREGLGEAAVLVSPAMSAQVAFSGNLRGVAGEVRGNAAGMLSAVRIFSATSPDEALELLSAREVKYIILPTMDKSLETLLSAGRSAVPPTTFYAAMGRWEQPAWMYPLAYVPPPIVGVEDASVRVFEVGPLQPEAAALARLAEYFVEMGNSTLAGAVARRLEPHDSDLGALAARALVSLAQKNSEGFQRHLGAIVPLVEAGMSGYVPWDQRITLALILAQGKQSTLLKAEMETLVAEADEARFRALSHTVLLRFLKLCKLAGTPLPDPALEQLALELLPEEARGKL